MPIALRPVLASKRRQRQSVLAGRAKSGPLVACPVRQQSNQPECKLGPRARSKPQRAVVPQCVSYQVDHALAKSLHYPRCKRGGSTLRREICAGLLERPANDSSYAA